MKRIVIVFIMVFLSLVGANARRTEKELQAEREKAEMAAKVSTLPVELQRDYYEVLYKDELAKNKSYRAKFVLVGILFFMVIASTIVVVRVKMKISGIESVRRIAELFMISSELEEKAAKVASVGSEQSGKIDNAEMTRAMIGNLFKERWSELNLLCNEYFEMENSANGRLSIVRNIEKEIDRMRTPKNVGLIVDSVNRYMDNIVERLSQQCPFLKPDDLTFMALLYARFSPRAVCLFTDIKLKYFYTKRSRIFARITDTLGEGARKFLQPLAD